MRRIGCAALSILLLALLRAPCCAAGFDWRTWEPSALAEEYAFETQSLDLIMEQFRTTYGLDEENFSMAYRATGSGETYFFEETVFRAAGSTYKLPLNMFYYDMERDGSLSPDTVIGGWSLPTLHYETIVNSNNDMAIAMLYHLGTFRQYRELMTQFCDQQYAAIYYADNYINAGYMLAVLQTLYDRADDYSELIGYLKQAMPDQYFKQYSSTYEIAHKYGYFEGAINDVGIIYTPEPFLLAAYTDGVYGGAAVLGRLCELLTEYTVWQTAKTQEAQAAAEQTESDAAETQDEAVSAPLPSRPIRVIELPDRAAQNAATEPAADASSAEETGSVHAAPWLFLAAGGGVLALAAGAAALVRRRRVVHK